MIADAGIDHRRIQLQQIGKLGRPGGRFDAFLVIYLDTGTGFEEGPLDLFAGDRNRWQQGGNGAAVVGPGNRGGTQPQAERQ